jgi:hypothetical protein
LLVGGYDLGRVAQVGRLRLVFLHLPLCGQGKGRGAVGGASQTQRQTTGMDEQQPREAPSLASAAFACTRQRRQLPLSAAVFRAPGTRSTLVP